MTIRVFCFFGHFYRSFKVQTPHIHPLVREQGLRLRDATAVAPRRLNAASCSWYAWNSHRLKQTQPRNKQPCCSSSAFPSSPPTSGDFSFSIRLKTGGGDDKAEPAAQHHHLIVRASLTSDQRLLTPFVLFLALSSPLTGYAALRSARFSSLFLNPASVEGGGGRRGGRKKKSHYWCKLRTALPWRTIGQLLPPIP